MQLREKILSLNEKIKEQMVLKSDDIKNSFEITQVIPIRFKKVGFDLYF